VAVDRSDELKAEQPREKLVRETRKFNHWVGAKQDGEWARDAITTTAKRRYEKHTLGADDKVVKVTVEELITVHDGYRPHMAGEKKTRKSFFHRGARVWR